MEDSNSKSRRLTMEEDQKSGRKMTDSGALSPILGAKSFSEREAAAGLYMGAFNWMKINGLLEKDGGRLPGDLDRRTQNA